MILPVYSYRDSLVGFGAPIVEQNEQTALRGFKYAINSAEGIMNFEPKDYDLYFIGKFDFEKGVLIPEPVPVMVVNGMSLVND